MSKSSTTLLLGVIFVFHPALVVQSEEPFKESNTWQTLSRSGKGVSVAKVTHEGSVVFVFFPLTNRERLTSSLISSDVSFPSLDAAISFLRKKPVDVTVSLATPGASIEDMKVFVELSEAEVSVQQGRRQLNAGIFGSSVV